jgi:phosphate transport system permease protein
LQALMGAGFVLFTLTLLVNFLANFIINKTARE